MKDTTGFPRLHIVNAWFKKSEQLRMFSLWQAYLPALAKDREAMPVLPQRFKNSKWVRLVLALPLPSKRESKRQHQRANEIEGKGCSNGKIETKAVRRAYQLQ
jgi:hypothetical protein